MRLRDAKARVERDHPELTGTAKIEAIKALRDADKASAVRPDGGGYWPSVTEAWLYTMLVIFGVRGVGWAVWDEPTGTPVWFDVLFFCLLGYGIVLLAGAYRRRGRPIGR